MDDTRDLVKGFEKLCAEVLRAQGLHVTMDVKVARGIGIDMVSGKDNEIERAYEVKLLLANPASLSDLRNVTSTSKSTLFRQTFPGDRLVLIISARAEPEHLEWVQGEFGFQVWDRTKLIALSTNTPELLAALEAFFADLALYERPSRKATADAALRDSPAVTEILDVQDASDRGQALGDRLRLIKAGVRAAKDYERITVDILDYLFGEFLVDARPQRRLEDRLSVLDVVYRVRPGHLFWDTLTRDFRARLMVFECKNYSKPIKAAQIYMTERYVQANALRPICFLVTRKKPHEHAELAAFGSMREGGKLFIFLSDDDLIEMLRIRDTQLRLPRDDGSYFENDPTVVLDQKIYDFLSRLPR